MSRYTFSIILFAIAITACNGGGGTGSNDGGGHTAESDLQISVPTPSYLMGSVELVYFNFINQLRQQLGLGLLAQNTLLDMAAGNHAKYLDLSGTSEEIASGMESPQNTNFTGVTAQDRCNHVGYSGECPQTGMWSEVYFMAHPSSYLGLLALTQGARQMGMAMHSTLLFTGMSNGPEIQLGWPSGIPPQRQAAGFHLVTQLWGAFHVQINEGETLTVDAFQVWDALGHEITGDILTSATDPLHHVPTHAVMLVPTSGSLVCDGSVYSVYLTGKRDGVPFTLTRSLPLGPYLHCG